MTWNDGLLTLLAAALPLMFAWLLGSQWAEMTLVGRCAAGTLAVGLQGAYFLLIGRDTDE